MGKNQEKKFIEKIKYNNYFNEKELIDGLAKELFNHSINNWSLEILIIYYLKIDCYDNNLWEYDLDNVWWYDISDKLFELYSECKNEDEFNELNLSIKKKFLS